MTSSQFLRTRITASDISTSITVYINTQNTITVEYMQNMERKLSSHKKICGMNVQIIALMGGTIYKFLHYT